MRIVEDFLDDKEKAKIIEKVHYELQTQTYFVKNS